MITAENTNHADLLPPEVEDHGSLEMGTVGWDDGSDYFDQGSTSNDGNTLVKVQLFRGKDPAAANRPGVGQGYKLLCQISSMFGIYWIPPQGTRVLVAIPAGMGQTQGAALIIAAYQTQTGSQFKPQRVLWDPGAGVHVLIKGDSASLQSHANPAQFVSVGTPLNGGAAGVYALDETGSGFSSQSGEAAIFVTDINGTVQSTCHLTASTAELLNKGTQTCGVQAKNGDCSAMGANFKTYVGMCYLGNATAITTLLANGVAISAAGPVNTISATVLASP